jgi:hypothetical protein
LGADSLSWIDSYCAGYPLASAARVLLDALRTKHPVQ